MKKILILWAALWCGLLLHAQEKGVEFLNITYQEALSQAKAENKLVFMDCYTAWCGPCQRMLKQVFPQSEAGAFFNSRFVNVKFDMEKGEGVELRKKFGIRAFPTFLLLRPDGTVQHRIVGGRDLGDFISCAERGMQEKSSLDYLEKKNASGKLNKKQKAMYMLALKDAGEKMNVKEVSGEEFSRLSAREKCLPEHWSLYDQREVGPEDERFVYLLAHKPAFDKQIGKEIVDEKIYNAYYQLLVDACNRGTGARIDSVLWLVREQSAPVEYKQKNEIGLLLRYIGACNRKDVEAVLNILEKEMGNLPGMFLWNVPFRLDFIPASGTGKQVDRYLALEDPLIGLLDNEPLKRITREAFEKHRLRAKQKESFAEVKGVVSKDKMSEVNLFQVEDGVALLIASTQVGKDGYYGFSFAPPAEGYYLVGGEKELERMRIYLKPGDKAEVNILEDTLVLGDRNTAENFLLAKWQSMYEPLRRRVLHRKYITYTYKKFFPYFLEFLPQAAGFKAEINTKNIAFNELLKRTIDYDVDHMALKILTAPKADLETHRPGQPKPEDYSEYYKTIINPAKLQDAVLLKQPYGMEFLRLYTDLALKQEGQERTLVNRLAVLPDRLLKSEIILWYAAYAKTYEQFRKITDPYAGWLVSPSHQRRWNEICAKLYTAVAGKEAADFTYPDRSGKMVSLSDFRGKVVVVDVWATWCGPCREEVPHLVKLEKEMAGEDVVFIGVSLDEKKDHQKWLNVLEKEHLEGIQLFANGWSKIVADYKIKGIPRFMVFDRKGNVVSANAPRPSDPALKVLLRKTIGK